MTEESIIKSYNEGINAVITLVKDLNHDFVGQMGSLTSEITTLNSEMIALKARIAELEARLNKNSNNSSKPPSTDGYKKTIKNNRVKSGRHTGGQYGHEGHTLLKVETPDYNKSRNPKSYIFDETGIRSEGKTKWIHVASTETLTYYKMHEKRGTDAAVDIGILLKFNGTSVHDHWKAYYTFEDCTHAECNAHNLRYLKEIYENFDHAWAKAIMVLNF